MQFLIPLREFFVRNFVTLKSVEVNKYKFYNNTVLYLLSFVPFYFLKLLFNLLSIRYIYKIDNIYFSNYGVSKISPILLNVNAVINENNKEDMKERLRSYNYTVPFWYFIINENLNKYQRFEFKYLSKGKMENKIVQNNEESNNMLIYDIF